MENNYEENQLEIFSNQYLKEIGMGIDEDLSDFNINSNKYKKIDDSLATRLNSLIQLFPNLINLSNYSGDVYRVVFDKGLGVLQTSAKYPGYFTGNVVQAGTNNKIVSGAVFQQLSMAPQIISGVFSVMSIVTGQYYMSQINNNLQKMEKEISDIKQYLKDDKKSRLLSREEFLRTTQDSLNYILENDMQKLSTITSIQKIKIDSLADINFYKDGEIKDNIKDYVLTSSQRAQYQNRAEELVKSMLISPATAKFPSSNQWNIGINKGIVFMQSFVDSQNAFGAVIRNNFKIKYDTKTATITSLIIDGEEQIKQPKPSKGKNKNKKK